MTFSTGENLQVLYGAKAFLRVPIIAGLAGLGVALSVPSLATAATVHDLLLFGEPTGGGLIQCSQGQQFCQVDGQGNPIPGTCVICGTIPDCPAGMIEVPYAALTSRTCDLDSALGPRVCDAPIEGKTATGLCTLLPSDTPFDDTRQSPCSPVLCAPPADARGTCSQGSLGSSCTLDVDGQDRSGVCRDAFGTTYCAVDG